MSRILTNSRKERIIFLAADLTKDAQHDNDPVHWVLHVLRRSSITSPRKPMTSYDGGSLLHTTIPFQHSRCARRSAARNSLLNSHGHEVLGKQHVGMRLELFYHVAHVHVAAGDMGEDETFRVRFCGDFHGLPDV